MELLDRARAFLGKPAQNKKGVGFGDISAIGIAVGLGIFVMAAIVMGVGAFKAASVSSGYDCATKVLGNSEQFFVNFSSQLPTIGTLTAIMLLLGVVMIGVGGGYMGYQYMKGKKGQ